MKRGENQSELNFNSGNSGGLDQWRAGLIPENKGPEALELNFATGSDQLTVWRGEQAEKMISIARREGLPIGEKVHVVLQNDLELTGRLLLRLDSHNLEVSAVPFQKAEIVSCVRVD